MILPLSFTEENYIKAIYHLTSDINNTISTNALAETMNIKPATVSDMIKKLSGKKMISYTKYKGVNLTPVGNTTALNIIRKHRLWEVFLVDKLNFNWDEVHEIAEQLEHIKSPLLVERLAAFLGNPTLDPHGDPIPDKEGKFNVGPTVQLTELEKGETGVIITVKNDDPELLQYLDKINIRLGLKIIVKEKIRYDNSMQVSLEDDNTVFLSDQISSQLMISKIV